MLHLSLTILPCIILIISYWELAITLAIYEDVCKSGFCNGKYQLYVCPINFIAWLLITRRLLREMWS